MTKEREREIDELYEFLKIEPKEQEENTKVLNPNGQRTNNFFEKRWDSSFFANKMRY